MLGKINFDKKSTIDEIYDIYYFLLKENQFVYDKLYFEFSSPITIGLSENDNKKFQKGLMHLDCLTEGYYCGVDDNELCEFDIDDFSSKLKSISQPHLVKLLEN